jgi:hypothetical protein
VPLLLRGRDQATGFHRGRYARGRRSRWGICRGGTVPFSMVGVRPCGGGVPRERVPAWGPTVPLWVQNGTVEIPCPVGPTGMSVGPCVGLLVGVLAARNTDMVSGCKPWPTNDCERPCVLVARHVVGAKISSDHPQRRFRRPSITVSGRDSLVGHRPPIVSVTSRQAV